MVIVLYNGNIQLVCCYDNSATNKKWLFFKELEEMAWKREEMEIGGGGGGGGLRIYLY